MWVPQTSCCSCCSDAACAGRFGARLLPNLAPQGRSTLRSKTSVCLLGNCGCCCWGGTRVQIGLRSVHRRTADNRYQTVRLLGQNVVQSRIWPEGRPNRAVNLSSLHLPSRGLPRGLELRSQSTRGEWADDRSGSARKGSIPCSTLTTQ